MNKLLLAASLPLVLAACAHVTPESCARARERLDKAEAVLVQARLGLEAACAIVDDEKCAKANRFADEAERTLDAAHRVVAAVCPLE